MCEVSYDFYKNSFHGSSISEADWPGEELKAVRRISYVTGAPYDEIRKHLSLTTSGELHECVCAVADALHVSAKSGNVSSESADGYSVTYSQKTEAEENSAVRIICSQYLYRTGLMYAGGYR